MGELLKLDGESFRDDEVEDPLIFPSLKRLAPKEVKRRQSPSDRDLWRELELRVIKPRIAKKNSKAMLLINLRLHLCY